MKRGDFFENSGRKMKAVRAGLIAVICAGTAAHAHASTWSLSLAQPDQTGAPGSTLVYSGTITNTSGSDLTLDAAQLTFTTSVPTALYSKDYSDDFLSTLGIIPSSGYTGALFEITWGASVLPGSTGSGLFALTAGSADPTSQLVDFSASVPVPAVPEPAAMFLSSAGGILLIALSARKRNTHLRR